MNVFELLAKISLDTTEYNLGLDAIKNGAAKIGSLGAKAIGAATAAVTAFGVASVKTGMGFDTAMSQVAATMGKTVDQMMNETATVQLSWGEFTGNLREYAQEMGANTVFSATQAAEALNYMALAGYDTQKSMETLPSVLNLAAAGAMDLASASDMVTDAETALGLAGKETADGIPRTTALIDEMARTASKTNTSVSQLGSAILTIGGTAKLLNGGMVELADGTERAYDGTTELSAALGLLADNGIKGSAAGTSLRNILSSLSSDKFRKTFGELGISAYDSEGKMRSLKDVLADMNKVMSDMTDEEKTGLINSTFNQRDLKSVNALLATTGSRWDEITLALLDSKGAAEEMAETQLDNLAGDVTLFQSALEGAQIALSDKVSPALRDFVKEGTAGLSGFTEKLTSGDINGAMDSIGNSIGLAVAKAVSMGPQLLSAGGALINGLISGMSTAVSQVDFVHVVIPMLVGLSGKIREKSGELVQAGLDIVSGIADGIAKGGSSFAIPVKTIFTNIVGIITDNVPVLFNAGLEMLKGLGEGIGENLPSFLEETALPMITQFSEFVREGAGRLVDTGIDFILNIAQGIMDSLPTLLEQVPQIIINFAGVINDNAPKLIVAGVELIGMIINGIISAIPTFIENIPKIFEAFLAVWSALNWVSLGQNVVTFIKNGIQSLQTQIPEALKSLGEKAVEFFKGINWSTAGQQAIIFIRNAITGMGSLIPNALRTLGQAAVTAFKSIDWVELGTNVIKGIVNGLTSGIGWIKDAAREAAQSALDAAKNFLGIESPSKVFREQVGKMIPAGLSIGIDEGSMDAINSAKKLSEDVFKPFNDLEIPSIGMASENGSAGGFQSEFATFISDTIRDNNEALIDGMYAAMSAIMQEADFKVQIGNREFGRILREAGAL